MKFQSLETINQFRCFFLKFKFSSKKISKKDLNSNKKLAKNMKTNSINDNIN